MYYLYLAWGEKYFVVNLSPYPEVDLSFWNRHLGCSQMLVSNPALPLGVADRLLRQLATPLERGGATVEDSGGSWWGRWWPIGGGQARTPELMVRARTRQLTAQARRLGWQISFTGRFFPFNPQISGDPLEACPMPTDVLEGRILFQSEIGKAVAENGFLLPADLERRLHLMYLEGRCELLSGVGYDHRGRPVCNRCGQSADIGELSCGSCGERFCLQCGECRQMGESRLCRPLYAFPGRPLDHMPPGTLIPRHGFDLTPSQNDAAEELRRFVKQSQRKECLVWAVCGAGKTEVSWAAMEEVLTVGGRVLFAVPRRDVVIDLEPRLRKAYPELPVAALFGGSLFKYREARVVLATTHQAIRFFHTFDLVILDEVDAFPYHRNPLLYFAVQRARRPEGKAIYMTATPGPELIRQGESGKIPCVRIPARYHGYPLPEPRILVEPKLAEFSHKGRPSPAVPDSIVSLLRPSAAGEGAPTMVFGPTVALVEKVGTVLGGFPDFRGRVEYTHSRDPERDRKRERFVRGEFPILVTTTIMERGVTIPGVNVLVLFAEREEIFDSATLIQIAGRCGRTLEHPLGDIGFVGTRITPSMKEALGQIRQMNAEAHRRGYLYNWLPAREAAAATVPGWRW